MIHLTIYHRYLLKKILFAIMLLIVIFIPIELFSRFIAATSVASFGGGIRVDQKTLVADSVGSGIVAIGDSILARSFYPELFASILSENLTVSYPVYNLAVEGSDFRGQLANLHRMLKKRIKPKLIIINIPVHALNIHYGEAQPSSVQSTDYHTQCEESKPVTIPSKIYCTLASKLYFFKLLNYYHEQINNTQKNLLHTAKTRHLNLIQNYPAVSYMGFSPVFNVLTPKSANTDYLYQAMINTYAVKYKVFKFGFNDFINGFMDDLHEHSTKIVLVLMPLYHPIMRRVHDKYAIPDNKFIVKELEQFAHRKNVAFINLFEELQKPENFQDPVHLNVIGATKATKLLAKKILAKNYTSPEGYLDSELYQFMKTNGNSK